jgi:Nuclease-related domain
MASPDPDHDRERFPLPWEDDDTPGLSIHPLSHADLNAILAHLGDIPDDDPGFHLPPAPTGQPRRPRAAASTTRPAAAGRGAHGRGAHGRGGRPGGSAQAEYQRRREVEHTTWAATLPWRIAATLGAGLAAVVTATLLSLPLPARAVAAVAALAAVGWRVRFRPSPETRAWARGAAGERHVARLLAPLDAHGWTVLHDLAVPGSKANIDHLVIGLPGVFVVDAKHYSGPLWLSRDGGLWHGRYPLAAALSATRWEADKVQATLGVADIDVVPIVAVVGTPVPFGQVSVHGIPVVAAASLPGMLRALPPVLAPERAAWAADQLRARLRPAANRPRNL